MTIESLAELLGKFFDNPKISSFRLMTHGKENITALVELTDNNRVIARMWGDTHGYMGAHSEDDIADEVAFMTFCYDNGIPVPKLFRSKAGKLYEKSSTGQCYVVMEYIDGETPQHFTEDMATQVAKAMAHMHQLVADFVFPKQRSWPGTVLDMTNERIARFEAGEYGASSEDISEIITDYKLLLKKCDLTALPCGVIHGDIMWENMKFKEGLLLGIFDFGDCRESYFVEDIAKS
ncbi:MAG TPA: phosphotransferase, partial [Candidatus Saccharimonadales bacterium]|nr:phosphotransferase [Candidatus Saccharimonadales bacterium]